MVVAIMTGGTTAQPDVTTTAAQPSSEKMQKIPLKVKRTLFEDINSARETDFTRTSVSKMKNENTVNPLSASVSDQGEVSLHLNVFDSSTLEKIAKARKIDQNFDVYFEDEGGDIYGTANPTVEAPITYHEGMAIVECCKALTAECLSCGLGMTEEDYCYELPSRQGCSVYGKDASVEDVYGKGYKEEWENVKDSVEDAKEKVKAVEKLLSVRPSDLKSSHAFFFQTDIILFSFQSPMLDQMDYYQIWPVQMAISYIFMGKTLLLQEYRLRLVGVGCYNRLPRRREWAVLFGGTVQTHLPGRRRKGQLHVW
jgi:hypothetical protein